MTYKKDTTSVIRKNIKYMGVYHQIDVRLNLEESIEQKIEWSLKITRVDNGYVLEGSDGVKFVVEDDESDELKAHEFLLWHVMEFFSFGGSKHDPERIRIIREKQE